MKEIELHVHTREGEEPKLIKIAPDATVEDLISKMQAAGAAIGEPGEEIVLWVEDEEVRCHKKHRIHECGMRHGHHVHCHRRAMIIIVNTRDKTWDKKEISYEEVVVLAFGTYSQDPNVVYTVTYSKGPEHKHEGSLVKGQSVKVKRGMIFNVSQTNRS